MRSSARGRRDRRFAKKLSKRRSKTMNVRAIAVAFSAVGFFGCAVQPTDDGERSAESAHETAPRGEHGIFGPSSDAHSHGGGGGGANGISYHGGPLLLRPTN